MATPVLSKDILKNTLLITHKNCMDGAGCSVIFQEAGGNPENIEFVAAGHGVDKFFKETKRDVYSYDYIIIVDVAPTKDGFVELQKIFPSNLIIIDHHASADFLCLKDNCHIDNSKCGTYLLFEFLSPLIKVKEPARHFAELTNDFDLWIREKPFSSDLSLYCSFFGQEAYVERALFGLFWDEEWDPYEGKVIDVLRKKREKYIKNKLKNVYITDNEYGKIAYIFASEYISDVLNAVLEAHDVDAAVGINLESYTVSCRSGDNFNSNAFCGYFGGGGHWKAAGHSLSRELIKEIAEMIHQ